MGCLASTAKLMAWGDGLRLWGVGRMGMIPMREVGCEGEGGRGGGRRGHEGRGRGWRRPDGAQQPDRGQPVRDPQFADHILKVAIDGLGGDAEVAPDIFRSPVLGGQLQAFALTRRQAGEGV
jgi:hypothetical protein